MRGMTSAQLGIGYLAGAILALTPAFASGQAAAPATYARDVAPILQEKCQACHRAGSVAPMTLLSYEDARQWAPMIREQVSLRIMPPWPLDTQVGIQRFKNDRSLTDGQIETIVAWVDAGAPLGDPADEPPPLTWPEWGERWSYEEFFDRPPDLVVTSPAYTVKADGMDQWPNLPPVEVEGIAGERWVRAVELRPLNPASAGVFHHGSARVANRVAEDVHQGPGTHAVRGNRDQLAEAAVGVQGSIFPEGTGRLLKEGDLINFNPHFYPAKLEEDLQDVALQVGVWLYPDDVVPYPTEGDVVFDQTQLAGTEDTPLIIAPHSQATFRSAFRLEGNARVHAIRGHMHLLGAYNVLEVVYPDGRYELINKLDWDQRWHTAFLYEDDAMPLLPKGTTVIITSVFDNTENNLANTDPDQWITGGSRTVDEMFRLRLGMTFYDDEEFARLVQEREAQERIAQRAAN